MSRSLCPSQHHLLYHFALPSEGPLPESPRNEVLWGAPAPSATSPGLALPYLPAENVLHLHAPADGAAVQGRCRPCASPDRAWLQRGSEALAHLGVKLWNHMEWQDMHVFKQSALCVHAVGGGILLTEHYGLLGNMWWVLCAGGHRLSKVIGSGGQPFWFHLGGVTRKCRCTWRRWLGGLR